MGMSVYANVCIGAVFKDADGNIEQSISEDFLEKEYEGYLEEYVIDKIDSDIFEIVYAGTDDYTSHILALKDHSVDTEWEPQALDIEKWNNIDSKALTNKVTKALDDIGVNYGLKGLIVSPYFSH